MVDGLLNRISATAQSFAQDALRGEVSRYLAEHREELLCMIAAAEHDRARGVLFAICQESPIVAGAVSLLMGQPPETAIKSIAIFDAELAAQLQPHLANFEKLQRHWRASAESIPPAVAGGS